MRRCTRCKNIKPLCEFGSDRARSDGINNKCKECARIAARDYGRRNKAKRSAYHKLYVVKNNAHLRERGRLRRLTKRAMCLIARARIRARRLKVAFDLDQHVEEIQRRIDAGCCEMTGLPFDLKAGTKRAFAPSLDRKEPALGYVIGNIRVVCFAMNAALNDWGEEILLQMLEAWQHKRASAAKGRAA